MFISEPMALKKRITLLLVLQILTLLIWVFIITLQWIFSPKAENIDLSYIAKAQSVRIVSIFLVSVILFKLYDQFYHRNKTILFWVFIIILVVIHAFLVELFENTINHILNLNNSKIISRYFFFTGSYFVTPLLLLSGVYFAVRYWESVQVQKENALRLEALANEAQLQMLQYQINPHFLFNALNTIRATIALDQDKARQMVTLLSDFFRYTLEKDNNGSNTIKKEVTAILNYLNIQKIRFEENIEFEFDIDPKTENIEIPFFVIHPLVENAVKFGNETSNKPLKIIIKSTCIDKNLIIEVSNTGFLIAEKKGKTEGTNTGIENIKKRLSLVYRDNFEFSLFEHDNYVTAKLIIKNVIKQ